MVRNIIAAETKTREQDRDIGRKVLSVLSVLCIRHHRSRRKIRFVMPDIDLSEVTDEDPGEKKEC